MESCSRYFNKNLSPEERAEDLLSRMTLEEKVGQMVQFYGRFEVEKTISEQNPGSILHILNEDAAQGGKVIKEIISGKVQGICP